MKRLFLLLLIMFLASSCSEKTEPKKVSHENLIIRNFFVLRQAGDTDSAWLLLSEKTRKHITMEQFQKYCFIYKVMDFELKKSDGEFQQISYSFYDKKMNKDGKLHNYFITNTEEYITVDKSGIIFPHVGFLVLRDAIRQKDMERAKRAIRQMLELSPKQPEVVETAKNMGLM
ncbi:hypothetical protein KAH37_07055 [bacterium]|nr:hypothetical protein [bacterium]